MPHYPISLDLKERRCLVIGGGTVAERKVEMLLEFGATVVVLSPDLTSNLRAFANQGRIRHIHGVYTPEAVRDAFLVIATTDVREVNKAIALECQRLGILVNVADDPELCTFFVPAIVRHEDFVVSVSTSGRSPSLAKRVKERLDEEFGPEYGHLADVMGGLRDEVKAKYTEMDDRAQAYQRIMDSDVLSLLKQGKREEALQRARQCI